MTFYTLNRFLFLLFRFFSYSDFEPYMLYLPTMFDLNKNYSPKIDSYYYKKKIKK